MDSKSFCHAVAEGLGVPESDALSLVKGLAEAVRDAALDGDSVALAGFGTFEPRKRDERLTVHPATGIRMLVPPRVTLIFRSALALKRKFKNQATSSDDE